MDQLPLSVWSIYGAQRAQPVATGDKWDALENRLNRPIRNRWQPTATVPQRMASRASAVGCHPLREVPSLRRRVDDYLARLYALFLRAVRARALVAATAGACLADHGEMILTDSSRDPSAAVLEARLRRARTAGDGAVP